MTTQTNRAAEIAAVQAAAASEEKARAKAVFASPEAKGRDGLARSLTFNTTLEVLQIIEALRHAPRDGTVETVAPEPTAAALFRQGQMDAAQLLDRAVPPWLGSFIGYPAPAFSIDKAALDRIRRRRVSADEPQPGAVSNSVSSCL